MKARFRSNLMKYRFTDKTGFTLIEVLIAITIFAIGLLAIAGMQVTGIRGNATSHAVMAKVAVADGILEEFMAMAGNDPRLLDEDPPNPWIDELIDGAGSVVATVAVDARTVGEDFAGFTFVTVTVQGQQGANVVKTFMKRRM